MVARESFSFHCLCWIINGYLFYWLRGVNDCCRFSLRGLPIRCLSLRRWLALLDFSISPRLLGDCYWVFPKMVLGPTWFYLLNLTLPCYSLWFETKAIRKRWLKVVDNFYSSKLMNKSRWQLLFIKVRQNCAWALRCQRGLTIRQGQVPVLHRVNRGTNDSIKHKELTT